MPPDRRLSLRIIDANLNRAREALRVMEEFARFGLDDATLCGAFKQSRHDLVAAVPAAIRVLLAESRNTGGDVGRKVRTESEYRRPDEFAVVQAAAKRLGEALRAIEEYAKTIDPSMAEGVEALRYQSYELEGRLLHTHRAKVRLGSARIYVLVTESLCRNDWFETAKQALIGGADAIQLREKDLSDRELLARGKRMTGLCHEHGAICIINDRPDIAALAGADGVHVGRDDVEILEARKILTPGSIVGVSTHTAEQVRKCLPDCPDYIAVGPMFDTATKPQPYIAGPDTLAMARQTTSLPLVAIGGITIENAAAVLATGCRTLAVCSAIIGTSDVTASAVRFRELVAQAVSCDEVQASDPR